MAMRKHSQIAVWPESSLESTQPKILQIPSQAKMCSFHKNWGVYLTDSGDAYELSLESEKTLHMSDSIRYISCNSTMACLISYTSQLFVVGKDPLKYGLLALENCFECPLTMILPNTKCVSVSVGNTHVGLVDRNGNVYMWGSGNLGELGSELTVNRQHPQIVQSAKMFSVKQIVCGNGFTVICTAGGFVYIYGRLASCQLASGKLSNPHSIKGLEKMFTQQIVNCVEFIGVLTDNKEAFVIDSCLKLVKLPCKYRSIAGCPSILYGISREDLCLHEWRISHKSMCKLQTLEARNYVFDEIFSDAVQVYSGSLVSLAFSCYFKAEGLPITKHYSNLRVQQDGIQEDLLDGRRSSCQSSPMANTPVLSKEASLGKIAKIFKRFSIQTLTCYFNEYKEHIKLSKLSTINKNISQLLNTLSQILQRNKIVKESKAFKSLCDFSESLRLQQEKQKNETLFSLYKTLLTHHNTTISSILNLIKHLSNKHSKRLQAANEMYTIITIPINRFYQISLSKIISFYQNRKKSLQGLNKLQTIFNKAMKSVAFSLISSIFYNDLTKQSVIDKLINFAGMKNKRILILKYFELWKRHRVSSKIAEISKKYASKTNARQLGMKISAYIRKIYKSSFKAIKEHKRPVKNLKYGIKFLAAVIGKVLDERQGESFKAIFDDSQAKARFIKTMNFILRCKMGGYYGLIHHFIEERKQYCLMKINLKMTSLYDKWEYRSMVRAFGKMKNGHTRNNSRVIDKLNFSSINTDNSLGTLKGDNSYNHCLKVNTSDIQPNSPFPGLASPISAPLSVKKQNSIIKKKPKKSLGQTPNKVKFNVKQPQAKETPQRCKFGSNEKAVFERLIDKICEPETPCASLHKSVNNVKAINKFQKDFEADFIVKYKLGLTSLAKTLGDIVGVVYLNAFGEIKRYRKAPVRSINLKFLESSSSSEDFDNFDDTYEDVQVKVQPSPWVLQLQSLAFIVLRKILTQKMKIYINIINCR